MAAQPARIRELKAAITANSMLSIAVLPFANLSADPENEYFCDRLAEELLNALTRIRDLRVVARTSAFSFKHQQLDVREIARRLNAATVLEGSVQRMGNQLRTLTQLINAADGYHLWSEQFDREMGNVFAIQDEIAGAIIDKLRVKLLPSERAAVVKRHTYSVEAFQLYLKGLHFWNRRFAPGVLGKAIEYFQQAIATDPRYSLAYAGLADCYNLRGDFQFCALLETFPSAAATAEKALEIDDTLAEAHAALGYNSRTRGMMSFCAAWILLDNVGRNNVIGFFQIRRMSLHLAASGDIDLSEGSEPLYAGFAGSTWLSFIVIATPGKLERHSKVPAQPEHLDLIQPDKRVDDFGPGMCMAPHRLRQQPVEKVPELRSGIGKALAVGAVMPADDVTGGVQFSVVSSE